MWPIITFENSIHQKIFDAIKEGNLIVLEILKTEKINCKKIICDFFGVNNIFNDYYRGSIYFEIRNIIDYLYNNIDLNNNVDTYPEEFILLDFFDRFSKLNKACDQGDIHSVIENIQLGDQFHVYSSEPIETAISCKNFHIADFLIKNGTLLDRWPGLLFKIIEREYDTVCHFYSGKVEFTGEPTFYALKRGAIVNHIEYGDLIETPLDSVLRINLLPVIEALRAAGAKTAAELLQEQLYCPLPFDPATAQGIPFSG